jgi:hypothetical protein
MIKEFETSAKEINNLLINWEPILSSLQNELIKERKNSQNRTIKQIIGHMIDSASNNTHRVIHLQYQESPLVFPNYASNGNNDRWIAIQDYQNEDWLNLVQLWKYSNLHYIHVMGNINSDKLNQEWIAGPNKTISLRVMVIDYLRHFQLHLSEIEELINS